MPLRTGDILYSVTPFNVHLVPQLSSDRHAVEIGGTRDCILAFNGFKLYSMYIFVSRGLISSPFSERVAPGVYYTTCNGLAATASKTTIRRISG